jgi:hypothetical protein
MAAFSFKIRCRHRSKVGAPFFTECSPTPRHMRSARVIKARDQGLSGPANADWSLRHEALALMPP